MTRARALCLLWVIAVSAIEPASSTDSRAPESADPALLGSPKFMPTPTNPIGWRGDGSGRYPGATGPTVWARKRNGSGYAVQNILWMARLPNRGVSCPIVVGERIFLTTEPADLVCLEKATGRILWIRSNSEFEGLPPDERKRNGAYTEKLAPLASGLAQADAELTGQLNAELGSTMASGALPAPAALQKKRDLEKKIGEAQNGVDKKLFAHDWAQAIFGYSGPTPVSDGKRVFVFFTTGVTACYDLNGTRKWIHFGEGGGAEHGNFASPVLAGNRLVIWAGEMRGHDTETGKVIWKTPAKSGNNSYGSLFRIWMGGDWVVGSKQGFFARAQDGKAVWGSGAFGDGVSTPVVEGGHILAWVGYPAGNPERFQAFRIPSGFDGGKPQAAFTFKIDWGADEIPVDGKKNPFDRGYCASPLVVGGLVYQMTEGGGLIVNNLANGEIVYRKVLPMKPRTQYWDWAGASASPTLAGKYVYLMDNQGTTVVLSAGPQYKVVATNVLEDSGDGREQAQNVSTPVFEGNRMYYRTPNYLYCIAGG